ncbi:hypothetical protein [Nocardia aurantia]|nr:hypothetical protein [Nocardia aurantia]
MRAAVFGVLLVGLDQDVRVSAHWLDKRCSGAGAEMPDGRVLA